MSFSIFEKLWQSNKIRLKKMLLHGILKGIFYLIIPLLVISILWNLSIVSFTPQFVINVIIFGTIGVIFSILQHTFPEDTLKYHIINIIKAAYAGIFAFFLFGGFARGFGTFAFQTQNMVIYMNLQLIAWLFLGSALVNAFRNIIKFIEFRKGKEFFIKIIKRIKTTVIIKWVSRIMMIIVILYIGMLVINALRISININFNRTMIIEGDGTPSDPDDDYVEFKYFYDVTNGGNLPLDQVAIKALLFIKNSTDQVNLPENTLLAISNIAYPQWNARTTTYNLTISLVVFHERLTYLYNANATIEFRVSFETYYGGCAFQINMKRSFSWTSVY